MRWTHTGRPLGLSYLQSFGGFRVAPALMARGATDFGLLSNGGPGSFVGGELSVTFSYRAGKEDVSLGLSPFVSYNEVAARHAATQSLFAGALAVIRFDGGWAHLRGASRGSENWSLTECRWIC